MSAGDSLLTEAQRTARRSEIATMLAWVGGIGALIVCEVTGSGLPRAESGRHLELWSQILRGIAVCTFVATALGYHWAVDARRALSVGDPWRRRTSLIVTFSLLGIVGSVFLFLSSYLLTFVD